MNTAIEHHIEQIYSAIKDCDHSRAREAKLFARKVLTKDDHKLMELGLRYLAEQNRKPFEPFK